LKNIDAIVVGELNMDLILSDIQQFPEIEKEVMAGEMLFTLGSSSAIFASNLSSMGNVVAFSGMIGKDSFGEKVITALKSKNVITQSIVQSDHYQTGITVAMIYGKERAMITHAGAMNHFGSEHISDDLLKSGKHLHISSIFLQPKLKTELIAIFNRAKSFGLTISLDPQWDPNEKWDIDLDSILDLIDVFLPNAAEWEGLTGSTDINSSLLKFKNKRSIIVIKDGANGAYCLLDGEVIFQPAFTCNTYVDAIGAGDSFDAGFINLFIQQREINKCLEYACLMGALNTTSAGGTGSFQSKKEISSSVKKLFNIIFK
jgi:sugar/nucleoside kinase (ribokinase family)